MNLAVNFLPLIIFLPLFGALINGLFGKRLGKSGTSIIAVAGPALSFVLALSFLFAVQSMDRGLPSWIPSVGGAPPVALKGQPEAIERAQRLLQNDLRASGWEFRLDDAGTVLRIRSTRAATLGSRELRVDDPNLKSIASRREIVERGGLKVGVAGEVAPVRFVADLGSWMHVGNLEVRFGFALDRLALILVLVITGVGTLIHLYSVGYMGHEAPGTFARYFTYLNLFVAAMLVLVMGGNLLLLFVGWEGVGMCSYLLIGFEYDDAQKAACGTKAFVVNRIGDVGFVLGGLTLLKAMAPTLPAGALLNLNFDTLNQLPLSVDAGLLGAACLLLFLGCTGKSAQIPLQVWLPDAMAGPTPVSALIHAATMVTAGVYMIARLGPLFAAGTVAGHSVLGIVALVGVLTAFFAGAAAIGQDDIKKVLAYSTISQLGYMFVGVGAAAVGASVFHLVTHAFFKALLFLGAGSVIHSTGTQSMREMGGLSKSMPTTFWTMTVGAFCLAGFPAFSGFFSKDMILFEALVRSHGAHGGVSPWAAIYVLGVLTGLLTAVYSTRLICMTFLGEYRGPGHPHESPSVMTGPLAVLAVLSLLGGALGIPAVFSKDLASALPSFLEPVYAATGGLLPPSAAAALGEHGDHAVHQIEWAGLGVGSVAAIVGVLLGWMGWGLKTPSQIPWESRREGGLARLRGLLANAWMYDELVNKRFIQPAVKYVSGVLWQHVDDAAIDQGLVNGTGRVSEQLSLFVRVFQNGRLSRYAAYFVVGVIVLVFATVILPPLAGR